PLLGERPSGSPGRARLRRIALLAAWLASFTASLLHSLQMQRDFELIRKLLFFFDQKEGPEHVAVPDVGPGFTESQIKYHCVLLYQAGFLNCESVRSTSS